MKVKNIKISDEVKQYLREANISGNRLDLVGQCPKYAELKKLFTEIGVVWHKKDKTHYMSENAEETINFILDGGQIVDKKKTLQAFFTPDDLAKKVVDIADVEGYNVLEPSAGQGAIVKQCIKAGANYIHCEEIDKEFAECLVGLADGTGTLLSVMAGYDFLDSKPKEKFERVVMNPPYDRNTWVKHIEHAWKFVCEGGKLVAICPKAAHNGFFKKFVEGKVYFIHEVESGAFKESGTNIDVMVVELIKYANE